MWKNGSSLYRNSNGDIAAIVDRIRSEISGETRDISPNPKNETSSAARSCDSRDLAFLAGQIGLISGGDSKHRYKDLPILYNVLVGCRDPLVEYIYNNVLSCCSPDSISVTRDDNKFYTILSNFELLYKVVRKEMTNKGAHRSK